MRFFRKGLLDVLLVVHYYEAWLAFLAILIWHMYATVFSPRVYPMNPSWITGWMPERQFTAEHEAAHAASNADAEHERATRRARRLRKSRARPEMPRAGSARPG